MHATKRMLRSTLATRLMIKKSTSSTLRPHRSFSDTPLVRPEPAMLEGLNSRSLGSIERHGKGDAYITLNVGGKEFHTLRSTVSANSVLSDHVARAEANHEITKNGSVFIDRNPDHFDIILQHLRNRVEYLSYSSRSMSHHKTYVQLPEDSKVLRDLFVEATYYRIDDLKKQLCKTSMLASAFSFMNSGQNPFDSVSKILARVRNLLLAAGGLIGTSTIANQAELKEIGQFIGIVPESSE